MPDVFDQAADVFDQAAAQAPNAGLAPPARPGIPQPLQQNPDYMQASREGTLMDTVRSQAAPFVRSAEMAGGMMQMVPIQGAAPLASMMRGAGTAVGGAGKVLGFAEKFMPRIISTRGGAALQGLGRAMQGVESAPEYVAPEMSLREQMAQGAAGMARRAGDIGERYQPRPAPTGRPSGARPPRPDLIDQMGGRPAEAVAESDNAVMERMEQSPEVQYGLNAKAHRGSASRSYPEPSRFEDQPPDLAPWGGLFRR